MFATDSACIKSILPLINALFVKSPGLAGLAPKLIHRSIIYLIIYGLPWQEISKTSSPVYDSGPLKKVRTASSKGSLSSSKIIFLLAKRGLKLRRPSFDVFVNLLRIAIVSGPVTLLTPMPA